MLKLDALSQLKQLKTEIKASRNLMIGTVKGSAHKFGFVTLESGKDIYLPSDEMQKVLPGDKVEVEVKKDAKNKNVALIERLINSPTQYFHGKYLTRGSAHFVDPDLPGMSRWIFVPPSKRGKAKARDMVKCRISQHPFRTGKAQAAVLDILGGEQTAGIEWQYAISKHEILTDWSDQVIAQLATIDESLIEQKKQGREDLTHLPFVTIDARSTIDMDDALWASSTAQGWELFIAIADPVALIEPGSAIEQEGFRRAASVYFPGQQVPMLPEKLAGDLCSLVANKDRLVKVVKVHIKPDGELGDYQLVDGFIRSRQKMSYADANEILSSEEQSANMTVDDQQLPGVLESLKSVAKALNSWRTDYALVNSGRKEFFIELDDQQKIAAFKEKTVLPTHGLVEECMIAANRCVADFVAKASIPSVFVAHNGVRKDRQEALNKVLSDHTADHPINTVAGFVQLVKRLSDSEETMPLSRLIFRQLEKSSLALAATPHFGMGLDQYLTFTSPLRKASDFLVHRQVSALISKQPPEPVLAGQLDALASRLQHVKGAVFDVEQWLKCQYIAKQKGPFKGSIVRIFSSGFQVRLDDNGIEGFVSTKEMEGKFSFNQDLLTLKGKNQSFVLDQSIDVSLKQVDWSRKQIQFEVAESV